ncbi:MAG: hypothetical protein ACXWQQ_00040 [Pseudobdellovibrio sp.]
MPLNNKLLLFQDNNLDCVLSDELILELGAEGGIAEASPEPHQNLKPS